MSSRRASPRSHRAVARTTGALLTTVAVGLLAVLLGLQHTVQTPAAPEDGRLVDQATVTREDGRADTVAAMLQRRAEALAVGDRAAFLETVDDSRAEFREEQARWFDNLAAVPFEQWRLKLAGSTAESLVPATARTLADTIGGGSFAALVEGEFRIEGHDNAGQHYDRVVALTPRGGRWFVSGSFEPAGRSPHRELWDIGRVHVLEATYGLVLGLEPKDRLRIYASELDRAVPEVDRIWDAPWAKSALVVVTRTESEMAVLLGGEAAGYRQLAAVTRGELGLEEESAAAERIIVNPKAYRELSEVGRRVIMRHEVAHVAARSRTQAWTPRWLAEGFADYVGYKASGLPTRTVAQELAADVKGGFAPTALPADESFAATNTALAQTYELSWLACRLISERYGGSDTLVEFYRTVGGPGGGTEVGRAFRDVLGVSPEEFTALWQDYVRRELS
ncbi:MAG: hypothetical protein ACT4QG_11985 [Sporichthyaceae bacterium]